MGKNKKKKEKKPRPYTEDQRNKKVMSIYFQLMKMNMFHVLTDEIKNKINHFIKTGDPYNYTVDLPEYSRILEINLINDMHKHYDNYIRLKFRRIRVEGEEDNPINKLNQMQQNLFNDASFNDKE